ncbi:MAG: sigma-70 family RNA polymerase sigma factor [Phycisphaera sp. TMED9]|nr:MAG: sigma-70 family RNA polymerase sigma factor [Phycisphaera sp. TMED9]
MDEITPDQLATLVVTAGRGDEDAWRELVDRFAPRVFGLIRAQCRDEDLAEEITQSTFCTIAAKLRDYDEVGRFESWLMRIAMNRLRDEMRRRARQARPSDEATLVALAGEGGRAEDVGTDDLPAGPLREAIEQLPEADREVLYLRHVSGLSFKQLAEALDAPVGTLLARHHRALKKVKAILEGQESEESS